MESEMTINIGYEFEPFEWKVLRAGSLRDLSEKLNELSQNGWDIFEVKIEENPTIIVRRSLKESD